MSDENLHSALSPPMTSGPPEKQKKDRTILWFFIKIAVIALILFLALTFVIGIYRLGGNEMYPALRDGDLCITYRLEDYRTGDVVAYRVNGQIRFARIVALAGDTVDGDEYGLIVNGSHLSEAIFYPTDMHQGSLEVPVTVQSGHVLVLNDYREDLNDSRTYGVLRTDELKGKVIFILRRRGF